MDSGHSMTDWSFVTAVHHDNNIAEFYRNGVLVGSDSSFPAKFHLLKIGVNRGGWPRNLNSYTGHNLWKGYIDEVKVYGRALDLSDINNSYTRNYPWGPSVGQIYPKLSDSIAMGFNALDPIFLSNR